MGVFEELDPPAMGVGGRALELRERNEPLVGVEAPLMWPPESEVTPPPVTDEEEEEACWGVGRKAIGRITALPCKNKREKAKMQSFCRLFRLMVPAVLP